MDNGMNKQNHDRNGSGKIATLDLIDRIDKVANDLQGLADLMLILQKYYNEVDKFRLFGLLRSAVQGMRVELKDIGEAMMERT